VLKKKKKKNQNRKNQKKKRNQKQKKLQKRLKKNYLKKNQKNKKNQQSKMRFVLRSKIHKAKVTDSNLNYIGSITIDQDLIEKAGFFPGEKVLVVSNTSGARLETYVMIGK
jgi:hypothetical protein